MYMNKISIYQLKSVNVDVLVTIPFLPEVHSSVQKYLSITVILIKYCCLPSCFRAE